MTIAVVIPSYNHARYIAETIQSVFDQTLRPTELHVIDDGSTDNSVEIVERTLADSGSIHCTLKVRPNRGCSATINELIEPVTTDFVAILNSDDLYAPDRLRRMLDGVSTDRPYFAVSGVEFLSEADDDFAEQLIGWHRELLYQGAELPTAGFAFLRANFAISSGNMVFSRALFDKVGGFREPILLAQDWDFALRTLQFAEPVLIPERLFTYRLHPTNSARSLTDGRDEEVEDILGRFAEWAARPSENPLAPTPHNWPHFFPLCARICQGVMGRPLATLLPPELCTPSGLDTSARETEAIRRLITAARASGTGPSPADPWERCARVWTQTSLGAAVRDTLPAH